MENSFLNKPISHEEIANFRRDTPGTKKVIHFNNAGCALPPESVVRVVIDYTREEAIYGGYRLEIEKQEAIQNLYVNAAKLLKAKPNEIAFTGGATISWRIAFNGIKFEKGDEIITTIPEYGSNYLAFLQCAQSVGVQIRVIPNDLEGKVSISELVSAITSKTKLVAITHIPSFMGLVQPAVEIGKITKQYNILYLLDACQSAGQLELNVEQIGCDILTLTGRKFLRGPRGTGLLYIRSSAWNKISPIFLDIFGGKQISCENYELRNDARRYETFESNRALMLGLSEAIRYALSISINRIQDRIQMLATFFLNKLQMIQGLKIIGSATAQSGIISFVVEDFSAIEIAKYLESKNINISVSGRGASYIYMNKLKLDHLLRISIHYYNTKEEIHMFCEILHDYLKKQ